MTHLAAGLWSINACTAGPSTSLVLMMIWLWKLWISPTLSLFPSLWWETTALLPKNKSWRIGEKKYIHETHWGIIAKHYLYRDKILSTLLYVTTMSVWFVFWKCSLPPVMYYDVYYFFNFSHFRLDIINANIFYISVPFLKSQPFYLFLFLLWLGMRALR